MADNITNKDDMVYIIKKYREDFITAFGAGDITYQIRGEA